MGNSNYSLETVCLCMVRARNTVTMFSIIMYFPGDRNKDGNTYGNICTHVRLAVKLKDSSRTYYYQFKSIIKYIIFVCIVINCGGGGIRG